MVLSKPWVNKSRSAKRLQNDEENTYQVIRAKKEGSTLDAELNKAKDTKVLAKSLSRTKESIFIHTKNKDDLKKARDAGDLVVRTPKAVPLALSQAEIDGKTAYFPQFGQVCTPEETFDQASKIDALGDSSIVATGAGTLIIVWDFIPTENSQAKVPEFDERPGGGLTIYRNGSSAVANHGVQVASIAGGKFAGPATGANMALLGLGKNVLFDLDVITELAEFYKGPVIVNMSFALEWSKVSDSEVQDINDFMDLANSVMKEITENYPVLFFVAAGNESFNLCKSSKPLSWNTGTKFYDRVMAWPQFARNKETPFTQVGATTVTDGQGRPLAIYSNYGDCVSIYSHGGVVCGWDTDQGVFSPTQGTSFASPLVAGAAAALFSEDLSQDGKTIISILNKNATDTVSDLPSGSINKFMQLPQLDPTPGGTPISLPAEKDLIGSASDPTGASGLKSEESFENWGPIIAIVVSLVLIFALGYIAIRKSKKRKR